MTEMSCWICLEKERVMRRMRGMILLDPTGHADLTPLLYMTHIKIMLSF